MVHQRLPLTTPAISIVPPANHCKLPRLMPWNVLLACPSLNALISTVSPVVPSFLMRPECFDRVFVVQGLQNIAGVATANHQWDAVVLNQLCIEFGEAIIEKAIVAMTEVGLLPELGLQDIQRHYRAVASRFAECLVVGNSQISLEPNYVCHRRLVSAYTISPASSACKNRVLSARIRSTFAASILPKVR